MMLITGPHRILLSMLQKLGLGEAKRLKSKSVTLFDFGARIKVVVSQPGRKSQIMIQITFNEDYEIHNESIDHLRMLYGPSVMSSWLDEDRKITISVVANEAVAQFDSPDLCALSLSQIRVQAAGAPILKALNRLDNRRENQIKGQDIYYRLGRHGKCGTYHCISTDEK